MSTLNVANITDGTDTVATGYVVNGSAKAWVRFNGAGTVAIVESFNISSLSDNGVGVYQVDFSSAMATSTYPAFQTHRASGGTMYNPGDSNTTTSMSINCYRDTGALLDPAAVSVGPIGELA